MNCPSRTDEPPKSDGLNQNPNDLSNDLTTNEDLKGIANSRKLRRTNSPPLEGAGIGGSATDRIGSAGAADEPDLDPQSKTASKEPTTTRVDSADSDANVAVNPSTSGGLVSRMLNRLPSARSSHGVSQDGNNDAGSAADYTLGAGGGDDGAGHRKGPIGRFLSSLKTFYQFIGPGFIVSVAYIDPGNYATDIAAGASYRYRLLFVVLLSNIFAIFLQSLSIKLGTVSGRNLAVACRAFLPRWLNISLYILAEVAIIATDIAEVIGTAIALNLLQPRIPLVAGCAISIVDVFIVLIFCKPENGTRKGLRAFELVVVPLVLGVVVCFCIQLSMIDHTTTSVGEVFKGYLPSSALIQQKGLYQACGILGATVMPHSLYLGSGIVQARLRDYDEKCGLLPPQEGENPARSGTVEADVDDDFSDDDEQPNVNNRNRAADNTDGTFNRAQFQRRIQMPEFVGKTKTYTYKPSQRAIKHCYKYSVAEVAISLFTFALFVNSAILIVAGSSLYKNPDAESADIFAIHDLLSTTISKAAGTIFALALLLSGLSAGVVCTVAGQMICEGALQWKLAPWLRRLLTRSISIMPSIVIAGAIGREGLDTALNASQVILSIVLPFITAPLLWFTTFDKYMTVQPGAARFTLRRRYRKGVDPDEVAVDESTSGSQVVKMANSWPVAVLGFLIWLIITVLNVANIVLLAIGE